MHSNKKSTGRSIFCSCYTNTFCIRFMLWFYVKENLSNQKIISHNKDVMTLLRVIKYHHLCARITFLFMFRLQKLQHPINVNFYHQPYNVYKVCTFLFLPLYTYALTPFLHALNDNKIFDDVYAGVF